MIIPTIYGMFIEWGVPSNTAACLTFIVIVAIATLSIALIVLGHPRNRE